MGSASPHSEASSQEQGPGLQLPAVWPPGSTGCLSPPSQELSLPEDTAKGDHTRSTTGWVRWQWVVSLGHQNNSPSPNRYLLLFLLPPIFLTMASNASKTSEGCHASRAKMSFEGECEQRKRCHWHARRELHNEVPWGWTLITTIFSHLHKPSDPQHWGVWV